MNTPVFSVIIPAHQAHDIISNTIECLSKNKSSLEIVISPDDGTDYSYLQKKYPSLDIKVVNSQLIRSGPGAARNRGIEIATGLYLAYIDVDDLCSEGYLDYALPSLEKYGICMPFVQYYCGNKIIRTISNQHMTIEKYAYNYYSAQLIVRKDLEIGWMPLFSEDVIRTGILLSRVQQQNLTSSGDKATLQFSDKSKYFVNIREDSLCATVKEIDINDTYYDILKAIYTKSPDYGFDKIDNKTLSDLEMIYKARLKKSIEYGYYLDNNELDKNLDYHDFINITSS